MKPRLSVIIITKDEEADLPGCLDSVRPLHGEIIVIDDDSSDRTVDIARRNTPHVQQRTFVDYASQKQAALDLATGEWALSIDADERISPQLADEITEIVNRPLSKDDGGGTSSPKLGRPLPDSDQGGASSLELNRRANEAGFEIPFEIFFMGRRLRFGGLGQERHLRLFRRDAGRFVGGVHEGIEVNGRIGRLQGKILHIPYRDLREYLDKMDRYTSMAAQKRLLEGRGFTPLHHLLPAWEFFVRTVLRLGILDGTPGLAWAGLSSIHTWIKFLKLRELQQETKTRQGSQSARREMSVASGRKA